MSSGRSHSDADLEAWQITQSPPQFIDPGFTRHSWLCAGGHGAVDKPAPAPSSVGAGLPAMAVGQSIHPAMTLRHREQARSYKCCYRPSSVGAGLPAMAVGQSIHPALTLRHREASSLLQMLLSPLLCGSWLASDGGGSVNTSGADIAPSRGKLAPTVGWVVCRRWRCVSHQPQSPNAVPSRRGSAPAAQPF